MNKWIEWFNVILPFTIFLLLSVVTGILSKLLLIEQQVYSPDEGPRAKISSVSISEADSMGNLTSIVKAESMIFFKNGNSSLTNPNLTLFGYDSSPLKAKSDRAEINSKEGNLFFFQQSEKQPGIFNNNENTEPTTGAEETERLSERAQR